MRTSKPSETFPSGDRTVQLSKVEVREIKPDHLMFNRLLSDSKVGEKKFAC